MKISQAFQRRVDGERWLLVLNGTPESFPNEALFQGGCDKFLTVFGPEDAVNVEGDVRHGPIQPSLRDLFEIAPAPRR